MTVLDWKHCQFKQIIGRNIGFSRKRQFFRRKSFKLVSLALTPSADFMNQFRTQTKLAVKHKFVNVIFM
jgi:hypothetical protein